MITYFVDTENVHTAWRDVCNDAGPGDEFLLFYSPASPRIGMDVFGDASLRGVGFKFLPCAIGENAMDFQIATELGHIVGSGRGGELVILSSDKGFDAVTDYWSRRGVRVRRQDCGPSRGPLDSPFAGLGLAREVRVMMEGFVSAAMEKSVPDKRVNYVHCRVGGAYPGKRGRVLWSKVRPTVELIFDQKAEDGADAPAVNNGGDEGRAGRPDAQAVARVYTAGLMGLGFARFSEDELASCVDALAFGMAQPASRRLTVICSRLRSILGDKRGRAVYLAVKPMAEKWAADGMLPPG